MHKTWLLVKVSNCFIAKKHIRTSQKSVKCCVLNPLSDNSVLSSDTTQTIHTLQNNDKRKIISPPVTFSFVWIDVGGWHRDPEAKQPAPFMWSVVSIDFSSSAC